MMSYLIAILLGLIVCIAQIVFLPALNLAVESVLNLPLLYLIIALLFFRKETTVAVALAMGLYMDLHGSTFFGFFTAIFLIEVAVVSFARHNILQNKNFISFLFLNWICVLVWYIIYFLAYFVWSRFNSIELWQLLGGGFWRTAIYLLAGQTVLVVMIYVVSARLRNSLKSDLVM